MMSKFFFSYDMKVHLCICFVMLYTVKSSDEFSVGENKKNSYGIGAGEYGWYWTFHNPQQKSQSKDIETSDQKAQRKTER